MNYNTIYAVGENNESGIWSRQVPVWRGLISIVLSVINSGPNNDYGIDRIPVCTGSGMYRLHCIRRVCSVCSVCSESVFRELNGYTGIKCKVNYCLNINAVPMRFGRK